MPDLLDKLRPGSRTLWIEVAPPRGVNPEPLLKRLAVLSGRVGAINLTDNALGNVKMSGLVFASILKARLKVPVVLNVSCRDRNRFALKSDLLGAAALGIDAVVALKGDKVSSLDRTGAHAVHDLNTLSLLRMIRDLNRGDTGEGKRPLRTLPRLVAGSVANPNRASIDREFELLARKAEAGARFVITQPVFEAAPARRFVERARSMGLKTVLGILPIKHARMAGYMSERVRDLQHVRHHFDRFTGMKDEAVRASSLGRNLDLMKELAREAAGFNIMSGGGPSLAIELALEFSRWQTSADP